MRNFMFLLLFTTLFSNPLIAGDEKEYFIGFKGGVSIPKLSGGEDHEVSRDYKSRVAPNFGAFFELGVTKKFSVQPEVNFAGQGGKRDGIQPITQTIPGLPSLPEGSYFYGDFETTAVLNYLEVPFLAKYKFGKKEKTRVYVNGGVFYGLLLTAETKTKGSSTIFYDPDGLYPVLLPPYGDPIPPIPFDATTDIKDDVNKNNFGFTGGGGIEIPAGKNYFLIDIRVSRGIVTIQKDTEKNGSSHTGNVVISFGYAFNVG